MPKLSLPYTEGIWLCTQFAAAEAHPASAGMSRGGPQLQQPTASSPAAPRGIGSAAGAPPAHGRRSQGHSPGTEPYDAGQDTLHAASRSPPSSGAPAGGTYASEGSSGWGHAAWRSPPGSGALVGGLGVPQGSSGWGHAAWRSPPGSGAPTGGTFGSEGSSAGGTPPGPAPTPSGAAVSSLGALSALRAASVSMPNSEQDRSKWCANARLAEAAAGPGNSAWAAAGGADSGGRRRWDGARSPDPTLSPGVGAV